MSLTHKIYLGRSLASLTTARNTSHLSAVTVATLTETFSSVRGQCLRKNDMDFNSNCRFYSRSAVSRSLGNMRSCQLQRCALTMVTRRDYSNGNHDKFFTDIRSLNAAFEEARAAIEDSRESSGTTYYADDYEDAEKVTKAALDMYQQLLQNADEKEKEQLEQEHDQRMKQLQEEFKSLPAP